MATDLGIIIADFQTQLATAIAISGTSATLQSATDDDGVALPAGRYFFTLDGDNSAKEHIVCDLSSTALTNIKTVSRQGVETSGVLRKHRVGATVTITDFKHIRAINDLVSGAVDFNASEPLGYDGTASITTANQLATKAYVDGVAIAGAPDASTTVKGISKLSSAPASPTDPIAVGDNDTRVPTQDENNALVGTSGAPSTSNKYVTDADTATAATASKVARRLASGDVTVPSTPTNGTDAASKTYVDANGGIDTTSYVLGESFTGATTPQTAYVVNDLWQWGQTHLSSLTQGNFGMASGNQERRALKIVPKRNVTIASARIYLIKIAAPTDNALIEIQTDSAGSPSGTPVTNGTSSSVAGTALSTTAFQEHVLTFAVPPALTAGTTYWVVFKRSSTLSNTDYYGTTILDYTAAYASFTGKTFISAAWSGTTTSGNLPHVELTPATGSSLSLWKTDANAASELWLARQFYGFCTTTGSANDNATLVKFGKLAGFTSLTIGTDYKTSDTAGGIATVGGGSYVGTAISATELNIPRIKYGNGVLPASTDSNPISGNATGALTTPGNYKLPFNAVFTFICNGGAGAATGEVYAGNDFGTNNIVARVLHQTGNEDDTMTVQYVRGTYIYPLLSTTNQSWTVTCTPIIE